jgi:hypothetical protein
MELLGAVPVQGSWRHVEATTSSSDCGSRSTRAERLAPQPARHNREVGPAKSSAAVKRLVAF